MLLSLQGTFPPAILALADGTVFIGNSIGATGTTVGEVVFNTAITGYQEILTDPSYCQQIVTLTYPHIGNYGVNGEDIEADKVHAAGLIIKDLPLLASNFRQHVILSVLVGLLGGFGGVAASYQFDLPCGPSIVLACVALFVAALAVARIRANPVPAP